AGVGGPRGRLCGGGGAGGGAPGGGFGGAGGLPRRRRGGPAPPHNLSHHPPPPPPPPPVVRPRLYHYRFTSRAERRETGAWWARDPVALWLPPLALDTSGELTASATGAWRRTPT